MKAEYVETIVILHILLLSSSASTSTSSYFWLITPPKGAPSYLFGTIHVPYTKLADALPENVQEALERSDGYGWMELDFGDPTDPNYGHHDHYPGGSLKEPLFDHRLASLFKSRNKSLHALEFHVEHLSYRKFIKGLIQVMKIELDAKLDDNENEYVDDAVDLLYEGGIRKDYDMLDEAWKLLESLPEPSPEDMLTDYLLGNVNSSIYESMVKMGYPLALNPVYEKNYTKLMSQRNKNMCARIRDITSHDQDKSFFFAIGVHHLIGAGKIQEHLSAAGFIVSRILPGVKLADVEIGGEVHDKEFFSLNERNDQVKDEEAERSVTDLIGLLTDNQILKSEAEKTFDNLLHMERMDGILRLLEPAYGKEDIMENVVDQECGDHFIKASDDLLAVIFVQVMYEVPLPEETDVIYLSQTWMRLVQKIFCNYGELDLQEMADPYIYRYVFTSGTAVGPSSPLEDAKSALFKALKGKVHDDKSDKRLEMKSLQIFLDEILDHPKFEYHQSTEVSRKYLAIFVLKMVVFLLKEMAVQQKRFDNWHELSNFFSEEKGEYFNLRPGYIRERTQQEFRADLENLRKNSKSYQDLTEKLNKYYEDNEYKILEFLNSVDPIAPDTRNPKAKSSRGIEDPLRRANKVWKKKKRDEL